MGVRKIMIIRHAEKPGTYGTDKLQYAGINSLGARDDESLVTLGWERAGGIANLFCPSNGNFQNTELAQPDYIYAASPASKPVIDPRTGALVEHASSQRPFQTISTLYSKMNMAPANLNISFDKSDYAGVITSVLSLFAQTVLIAWQHEDILPQATGKDSLVTELLARTNTPASIGVPTGPWPGNRYDIVLVFDRPSGTGPFVSCSQVPQMLLAGDINGPL